MGYFNSIYAADLPHRAISVYMYLKDRSDAQGKCWPSIRTIAAGLSLSRSTVKRALSDLIESDWIAAESRWRENGGKTSNLFRILR